MGIKVSVYDEPQVALRPLPAATVDARVSPQDITGGVERGLDTVADVALKYRDEQDRARLMSTYAQLGTARLGVEAAVKSVRGPDALKEDLGQKALSDFDARAAQIGADLPDRLRTQFTQMVLRERGGLEHAAVGHTLNEAEAVKTDARHAAVGIAMKKAENASTPEAFEAARQEGLAAIAAAGGAHEAEKVGFLDHLDKLSLGGEARAKAVELEAKYAGDPLGLKKAIADAQALPNTKLADATVTRLKQRQDDLDHAQTEFDKQALGRIESRIEATKGRVDWGTDEDYGRLSDYAKGIADAKRGVMLRHRDAANAEDRRAAAEARRLQAEANKIALELYDSLPLEQRAGVNLSTGLMPDGSRIDPRVAIALGGVDALGAAAIMAKQRHFKELAGKGESVQYGEFTKRVEDATAPLDDKERAKTIRQGMDAWFFKYRDEHGGQLPGGVEVQKAMADHFLVVRQPGMVFDTKKTRAEFRAENVDASGFAPVAPEDQFYPPSREPAARILGAPARPGAPAAPAPEPQSVTTVAPAARLEEVPEVERKLIEDAIRQKRKLPPDARVDPADVLMRFNLMHHGNARP